MARCLDVGIFACAFALIWICACSGTPLVVPEPTLPRDEASPQRPNHPADPLADHAHDQDDGPDAALYRAASLLEEQAVDERLEAERLNQPIPTTREQDLRQQARRVYQDLIKSYPNSRYAPSAFLSFGESSFQEGDMSAALEFYRQVTKRRGSAVQGYALYKTAWCQVNLQDDRQALSSFIKLFRYLELNPDAPNGGQLRRQARRDLVMPYARSFPPTKAWALFQQVGGEQTREMMESLAEHYSDAGLWTEAATTYRELMVHFADRHELCAYQLGAARAAAHRSPQAEQARELRRTVDVMDAFVAGSHPEEDRFQCRRSVAQLLLDSARDWHNEARATRDQATMTLAFKIYSLVLASFADLDRLGLSPIGGAPISTALVTVWEDELRRRLSVNL
jgi:tetratricopeptide (TPR) repeat protein